MDDFQLNRSQGILLGLMAGVAGVVFVASLWADAALAYGLKTVSAFLFVYLAAVLISHLPDRYGGVRSRAWVRSHVAKLGAGFYGVMGLATFLILELRSLLDDFSGPFSMAESFQQIGINWLIGFSIESIMNIIWASMWPVILVEKLDVFSAGAVVGLCWLVHRAASERLPAACLADEDKEQESPAS